jgi:hypothetical protein
LEQEKKKYDELGVLQQQLSGIFDELSQVLQESGIEPIQK